MVSLLRLARQLDGLPCCRMFGMSMAQLLNLKERVFALWLPTLWKCAETFNFWRMGVVSLLWRDLTSTRWSGPWNRQPPTVAERHRSMHSRSGTGNIFLDYTQFLVNLLLARKCFLPDQWILILISGRSIFRSIRVAARLPITATGRKLCSLFPALALQSGHRHLHQVCLFRLQRQRQQLPNERCMRIRLQGGLGWFRRKTITSYVSVLYFTFFWGGLYQPDECANLIGMDDKTEIVDRFQTFPCASFWKKRSRDWTSSRATNDLN